MLTQKMMLASGTSSAGMESWSFTVSVGDDTENQTGIPVNLYDQNGVTVTVDWGDGSSSKLSYSGYSETVADDSIHTYDEAGEYQVTIYSVAFDELYLEACTATGSMSTGHTQYQALNYWRQTLVSVDTSLPTVAGVRYRTTWDYSPTLTKSSGVYALFYRCSALASIPDDLFTNNSGATTFGYCFRNCSSLASIPEGLFDSCSAAKTFTYCFYGCSSLASIPEGLFDNCAAVTTFSYCFAGCESLTAIPEGLFDSCTKVTTFLGCFRGCESLTAIPEGLFDSCTKVTTFRYCFYGCYTLTSIPDGLFSMNTAVTSVYHCFGICVALESFPEDLLATNTALTEMDYLFNASGLVGNYSLRIGSEIVSSAAYFAPYSASYSWTIYVPDGSTTQETFEALADDLYLTVIGE